MAHRKRKRKVEITQRWVVEYAHSLYLTLQQSSIPVHVVVAGPFVGLTFGISESVTGDTLADALSQVISEMIPPEMNGIPAGKLLDLAEIACAPGLTDGIRPSVN